MKTVYVCHSKHFDFKKLLYEPLRNSSLSDKVKFIFPHEQSDKYYYAKGLFNSGNEIIVLVELSYESTGRDIEMGMAFQKGISIIGVHKKGSEIKGAQKFVCEKVIEYNFIEDLIFELADYLK